jgi:putative transposase
MIISERLKLNPTDEQRYYFVRACGIARFTWNWGLEEYRRIKSLGNRANWSAIQRGFNAAKSNEFSFVSEVTKSAYQIAFRDLRRSISTYYKIKKSNPKAKVGFPKLRSKKKGLGSFGLQNNVFYIKNNLVYIPRLGYVNISHQPRFQGKILSGRGKKRTVIFILSLLMIFLNPNL